jgi:hypothetical protein
VTAPLHAAPNWYPDPLGRAEYRYWDGERWTQWIADGGVSRPDTFDVPEGLPEPTFMAPPTPGTGSATMPRGRPLDFLRYRSISGLATALTWLLGASIVSALALAVACANRMSKVNALEDVQNLGALAPARSDLKDADDLVSTMAGILGVITLAIFIVFIVFLYRASKNTELWNIMSRTWTPGWAIGGWFIPLANFVIPALVVSDIWKRTPEAPTSGAADSETSTGIVWVWWVLFVIGIIGSRLDIDPDTFSAARTQDWINIVTSIALAASAVPLIIIVRTIARRQQQTAFPSTQPA